MAKSSDQHASCSPPLCYFSFIGEDRPGHTAEIMSPCWLRKGGGGWASLLRSLPLRLGAPNQQKLSKYKPKKSRHLWNGTKTEK